MRIVSHELYRGIWPDDPRDEVAFLSNEEMLASPGLLAEAEVVNVHPYMLTADFIDRCPRLRWASTPAAGVDGADVGELRRRGIVFTNGRGNMSVSIAEDALCKMLMFSRRARDYDAAKARHEWITFGVDPWMAVVARDLFEKRLGIVGDGCIAQELARRARAFGMHVSAYGRHGSSCPLWDDFLPAPGGLEELLSKSDYVMVACALTDETRHLIDARALSWMKPGAFLVNSARGAIVAEPDLIRALREQAIGGAALDVFEEEPLPADSPLWDLPNVWITTHKAGAGDSWVGRLRRLYEENLEAFRAGAPLRNVVC